MRARGRVRWPVLVAVLALALVCAAACTTVPACAAGVRTARLMPAFFATLPVDPSAWLARPVLAERLPLQETPERVELHIWRPPGQSRGYPALVVSLGVNPAPPDDPRVTRLFRGLARAGLVAVLVEQQALNEDRLTSAAPAAIVRAVERVRALPSVRDGRVGLLGFSVGAALVEIAAADPRIRDHVTVVEGFGGYARLADLVQAATTGVIQYRGHTEPWQPDPMTVRIVRENLIADLPDPRERDALWQALVAETTPLPPSDTLSAYGRAVLALLTSTDPDRFHALFAALPERRRQEFEALSPVHVLDRIRARVFLMHDRGDPLIPYVESRRSRDRLSEAGNPPYYSEFAIFEHVDPTRGGNPRILVRDGLRLFLHAYWVLRELE
jgi:hypothetical protein